MKADTGYHADVLPPQPRPHASTGLIADDEVFVRMTGSQRLQHLLLVICFVALVLTGFPLLYPDSPFWSFFGGSFWWRSQIHRFGGVGLLIVSVWHLTYVLLTEEGSRYFRAMMPKPIDARQMVEAFMHRAGVMQALYRRGILRGFLDRHPWWRFDAQPEYGRFNWIEKFEYLAVMWGNAVMIVTGLCLWFFEAAFALFPKPAIDVIKVVHGFEALLAFLAIIIWHMYHVHLSPEVFPMGRVWLHGKITGAEMRHHYPAWYREIESARLERRRIDEALRYWESRRDLEA